MKYNNPEDEPHMVHEPAAVLDYGISPVESLWAQILNQSIDVQSALADRLNALFKSRNMAVPYTMEELHNRLVESEIQFQNGECLTNEEVNQNVDKLFESWK